MLLVVADASVVILNKIRAPFVKNKPDPGMFPLSLECIHCAKLDFLKTLTNSRKVVRGHC